MKYIICVIYLLQIFEVVYCNKFKQSFFYESDDFDSKPLMGFLICVGIAGCIPMIIMLRKFYINLNQKLLVLLVGTIIAIVLTSAFGNDKEVIEVFHMENAPIELFQYFYPIYIVRTCYTMDRQLYLRLFHQVLLISSVGIMITGIIHGCTMAIIIGHDWHYSIGLIYGLVFATTQPYYIIILLKDLEKYRNLPVLIEGEAVLSTAFCLILTRCAISSLVSPEVEFWYIILVSFVYPIIGGFIVGLILAYGISLLLYKVFSNDTKNAFSMIVALITFSYILGNVIGVSPEIVLTTIGIFLNGTRSKLSQETDKYICDFLEILYYVVDMAMYLYLLFILAKYGFSCFFTHQIRMMVFNYVMTIISRFMSMLILYPILARLSKLFDFKCLVILTWCSISSNTGMIQSLSLFHNPHTNPMAQVLIVHYLFNCVMSLGLNSLFMPCILRVTQVAHISASRQINMKVCLEKIRNAQERYINLLKEDRFMTDVNWPFVRQITTLEYPYYISKDNIIEDDFIWKKSMKTKCPDCKNDVVIELTQKDIYEMNREARTRVIKGMQVLINTQYETGLLSRECKEIITKVLNALMEDDENMNKLIEQGNRLYAKNVTMDILMKIIIKIFLFMKEDTLPPRKHSRRVCYRIVGSKYFEAFMYIVSILSVVPLIVEPFFDDDNVKNFTVNIIMLLTNLITNLIFFAEFILKILSYSWMYICRDGFRLYFRNIWNIIDFIVMFLVFCDSALTIIEFILPEIKSLDFHRQFGFVKLLKLLRLLRLLRRAIPSTLKRMKQHIEIKLTLGYEYAKSLKDCYDALLLRLDICIDNPETTEPFRQCLEEDRVKFANMLVQTYCFWPWLAVAIKSKQVCRYTIFAMTESIYQLKSAGHVDDIEFKKLLAVVSDKTNTLSSMWQVQPCAPPILFQKIPWIAKGLETWATSLFEKATLYSFAAGDVLCELNSYPDCIFVLTKGFLISTYETNAEVIKNTTEYGYLPIIDYIETNRLEKTITTSFVPGNSLNDLSYLTERAANATIVAKTAGKAFAISFSDLDTTFHNNPITGLKCQMWKSATINLAITLMLETPAYARHTQSQVRVILDNAIVPDLAPYKVFEFNELVDAVILLDGIVVGFNEMVTFVAPCYVPRTALKLYLCATSTVQINTDINCKLMILFVNTTEEMDISIRPVNEHDNVGACHIFAKRKDKAGIYKPLNMTNALKSTKFVEDIEYSDVSTKKTKKSKIETNTTTLEEEKRMFNKMQQSIGNPSKK